MKTRWQILAIFLAFSASSCAYNQYMGEEEQRRHALNSQWKKEVDRGQAAKSQRMSLSQKIENTKGEIRGVEGKIQQLEGQVQQEREQGNTQRVTQLELEVNRLNREVDQLRAELDRYLP